MIKNITSFLKSPYLFVLGCLILIFFASLKTPYDPDMGWHLQNGHYLLTNQLQVPKTDIYSYTMADYPLIMHEWVSDIIMYGIYRYLGFWGLSLIFAVLATAAFFIVAKSIKAKIEYQVIAALIGALASYTIVGIRPQVITLLFLGILLFILYRFKENPNSNTIYWLLPLFLLWVNMHGGFVIGLFTLVLYLVAEFLQIFFHKIYQGIKTHQYYIKISLPKHWFKLFYLTLLSGIATLVNPYFWRVYVEIYSTLRDPLLKSSIAEWFPVTLKSSQSYFFLLYVVLIFILGLLFYKRLKFTSVFMFLVFGYIGITSWRNMPLFIIFSIPLWVFFVKGLVGETLSKLVSSKLILTLLILAVAINGYQQVKGVIKSNSSEVAMAKYSEYRYPYDAVLYLKAHPPKGNMFNYYNWGGYLIWQLPAYKVFIDGRMPSWRYNGKYVWQDFHDAITLQSNWQDILEKYKVSWIFLDRNSPLAFVLASSGWKNVYVDDLAIISIKGD